MFLTHLGSLCLLLRSTVGRIRRVGGASPIPSQNLQFIFRLLSIPGLVICQLEDKPATVFSFVRFQIFVIDAGRLATSDWHAFQLPLANPVAEFITHFTQPKISAKEKVGTTPPNFFPLQIPRPPLSEDSKSERS